MKPWNNNLAIPSAPISNRKNVAFADLYLITLADGTQVSLTSADREVYSNGPIWYALPQFTQYQGKTFHWLKGPKIKRSSLSWDVGSKPTQLKVSIGGSDQALLGFTWQGAAARGLLDFAKMQLWRALPSDPNATGFTIGEDGAIYCGNVIPLFLGYIGEFSITRVGVEMTCYDARILFNQYLPKHTFCAACRWALFDQGCKLVRDNFAVNAVALGGSTSTSIMAALPQPAGYFSLGYLRWTSGPNVGQREDIAQHSSAAQSYSAVVGADRPILYLRLNEASGTTAHDISGNSFNGTLNNDGAGSVAFGGPALIVGDPTAGSAIFTAHSASGGVQNGGGRIVLTGMPGPITLSTWAGAVSVEFMYQCLAQGSPDSGNALAAFDSAPGQVSSVKIYNQADGSADVTAWWGSAIEAFTPTNPGNVHHCLAVFRGANTIDLYLNGVFKGTTYAAGAGVWDWDSTTADFTFNAATAIAATIGAAYDLTQTIIRWMNGYISEFAIYDYAASPDLAIRHATAAFNPTADAPAAQLQLVQATPNPPNAGDTFTVYPGCDLTSNTCQNKFNNIANFGGFISIPEQETAWAIKPIDIERQLCQGLWNGNERNLRHTKCRERKNLCW